MPLVDVALILENVVGELARVQTVVIDVHRASSTMVAALTHEVPYLIPVESIEEARQLKDRLAMPHYLGGERNRIKPAGFDLGNSPLEYAAIKDSRPVIYTTTNGTRALRRVAASSKVLVGSMQNARAVAEVLRLEDEPILLVCSGTKGTVAAEDVFCAGLIIDAIRQQQSVDMTDAAQIAYGSYLSVQHNLASALQSTHSGRALTAEGFGADVSYCSQVNIVDVVPQYNEGKVLPSYPKN